MNNIDWSGRYFKAHAFEASCIDSAINYFRSNPELGFEGDVCRDGKEWLGHNSSDNEGMVIALFGMDIYNKLYDCACSCSPSFTYVREYSPDVYVVGFLEEECDEKFFAVLIREGIKWSVNI